MSTFSPIPTRDPFLEDGSVIAVGDTTTPIPIEDVLTSANGLVKSVPVDALHTVAVELGAAFNGKGEDIQVLADSLSGPLAGPGSTLCLQDARADSEQ